MSERSVWKMLHLLYSGKKKTMTEAELIEAGVICVPDTMETLKDQDVVEGPDGIYKLTKAARTILNECVVANRRWPSEEMRVDYPQAFVIMPFREPWSNSVYEQMIKPAVEGAGLVCKRGDDPLRVGDLTPNIWGMIMLSGVIIADVSAPNVNVFYELGLSHALGKDTFILKQEDAQVPADIGGAHYYPYALNKLESGQEKLQQEINNWAKDQYIKSHVVNALYDAIPL